MAEMAESGGGHKEGKKRAKKSSTRVDMTPMVFGISFIDLLCIDLYL